MWSHARSYSLHVSMCFQWLTSNKFGMPSAPPAAFRPFMMNSIVRPLTTLQSSSVSSCFIPMTRNKTSPDLGLRGKERRNLAHSLAENISADDLRNSKWWAGSAGVEGEVTPVSEVPILDAEELGDASRTPIFLSYSSTGTWRILPCPLSIRGLSSMNRGWVLVSNRALVSAFLEKTVRSDIFSDADE